MLLLYLLLLAHLAVFGYLGYKLVKLLTADADLQVLGSRLKPDYFKGKVVWVTGASSGSTSMHMHPHLIII